MVMMTQATVATLSSSSVVVHYFFFSLYFAYVFILVPSTMVQRKQLDICVQPWPIKLTFSHCKSCSGPSDHCTVQQSFAQAAALTALGHEHPRIRVQKTLSLCKIVLRCPINAPTLATVALHWTACCAFTLYSCTPIISSQHLQIDALRSSSIGRLRPGPAAFNLPSLRLLSSWELTLSSVLLSPFLPIISPLYVHMYTLC